jgi:predicted glutamine amidotransferase
MCGLVGVAGDIGFKTKDAFKDLLVFDSVRGKHSTGIAFAGKGDRIRLVKAVGDPFCLFRESEFTDEMKTWGKLLLGHNRHATKGKITAENAHPFEFDNIVGAHNGTLHYSSIPKLFDHHKYETDSQAIFSHINRHGIEDAITKMRGAWALTWLNVRDNTINLLRNSERPLHYAYTEDMKALFWSSEVGILRCVLARHGIPVKENKVYRVTEDTLLTWEIPIKYTDKFTVPKRTPCKAPEVPKEEVHTEHYYGYEGTWRPPMAGFFREERHTPRSNVVRFPTKTLPGKKDTEKFRPPYHHHDGRVMTKPQFTQLVKDGCMYCDDTNIHWGDFIWPIGPDLDGRKMFLCKDCYNDHDIFSMSVEMFNPEFKLES